MRPTRRFALAAALPLLAWASLEARADRPDAFVALGKKTPALTVESPGDVATTGFPVRAGSGKKLNVTVRLARGSALVPDVRLVAPDGTSYDSAALTAIGAKIRRTKTLVQIKLNDVPEGKSGLWRVEVRGADDTVGDFSVQVRAVDKSKLTGTITVPAGSSILLPVEVGSNQAISITALRGAQGTTIVPKVRIQDPHGAAVAGGAFLAVGSTKTGKMKLRPYRLPVAGVYQVALSGEGDAGGAVKYTITTGPARPTRTAPVADAGAPTDADPSSVKTLAGNQSHGGGGLLSYLWTQVAGPEVELQRVDTPNPTFTAPPATASLAFELAVAENGVWSAPAPVTVEVGTRPLADAGRSQAVAVGGAVTLDGAGSLDRRGSGIRFAWRQDPADATQVTLAGADTPAPTFTAPAAPEVLHFGLTVDDGSLRSFEDFVTVRAGDLHLATPDAGRNQVVRGMTTVHLSALWTEVGAGALAGAIEWTQVAGPAVTLADPTSPYPSFTAPKQPADLAFRVTAGGVTDTVRVHVRTAETNLPPLTRAVPTQFTAGGNVTLNAQSGSTLSVDPNGDALSFRWAQVAGPALAPATPNAASTTVTVPAGNETRTYAVQARDLLAYGPPDFTAVRNTGYTGKPIAVAGPDVIVQKGSQVTLNGSGSVFTSGSGPLTWRWRQVSARDWFDVDARSDTFDPAATSPTFTFPLELASLTSRRTLTFELVVNDGVQDSDPDFVTVTVLSLPENSPPVVTADASATDPVAGQVVTLLGTASDLDGDPLTIAWTQVSGPPVVLQGAAQTLTPTFTAPASGTLTFRLSADDGVAPLSTADVVVTVDAAPVARVTVSPNTGGAGQIIVVSGATSSDPEGADLSYTWSQTAGETVATVPSNTTTTSWAFTVTATMTNVTFRLVVNDGRQNSAAATASFSTSAPIDVNPVSDFPSGAPYGATVTLDAQGEGTGSITYQWAQLTSGAYSSDPVVGTINAAADGSATFKVPSPTTTNGFSGGTAGKIPSATFQVTASNGGNQAVGTVKVSFYASLSNPSSVPGVGTRDTVMGIASTCSGSTCHNGSSTACTSFTGYGFLTSASTFISNNVSAVACSKTSKPRVDPSGGSGNSYLIDRLKGTATPKMPSTGSVTNGEIGLISDWIDQGCQNN